VTTPGGDAVIGIDLGTTNSAVALSEPRRSIRTYDIPQLVAAGEVGRRPTLPSFLYLPDQSQRENGAVRLPWNPAPEMVAGEFARDEGALVSARQVSSAKSWLSNAHVDRTAPLLPWDATEGRKISPVEASTTLLAHLRDAWNHEHAPDRFERHSIVLTVPASFDEEARELTVAAARAAGFERLTLLEEPLAALYAWIATHRNDLASMFSGGSLVLVCDVGGGTTDFSLIRAQTVDGEPAFERIAIGEHLLLGGDNLDLALTVLVEQKLGAAGTKLSLVQRHTLRRRCSAAKEQLLSDPALDRLAITILGSGRGVVGGGLTTEITRADVVDALENGFLPIAAPDDLPARDRRVGLRELGLPYETDAAITKHLAAFLTRAAQGGAVDGMMRPSAVLFNGGFFTPAIARTRILDALTAWFADRPAVLENARPEAAVAIGAAFYGRLKQSPRASKRLLIRAGSGRAYYVGVAAPAGEDAGTAPAICILPRGTEEGTRVDIDRDFTVITNQPSAFTVFSSIDRSDPLNALVALPVNGDVSRHAPLVTAFRYGKRSRRTPLAVQLSVALTETGTLELWCQSRTTDHRWRLAFNLRGAEGDPLDEGDDSDEDDATGEVVIADDAIARGIELIQRMFEPGSGSSPETLIGDLENALGHGKQAWPLAALRKLADALLGSENGRRLSAGHEVRWLNLTGFACRPGFGSALDNWRIAELRKVYAAGLAFPRDVQNQVEWIVLWQRAAAGFTAGQQRELAQRMAGQLGLGQRKPARINPQIERETWRLLASLERLDAGQRARIGDELVERLRREPRNASALWAMGRLGARVPLYGPLNSTVAPAVAERWIDRLLSLRDLTTDVAMAVAHIGARTGDGARDVSELVATRAGDRLVEAGFADVGRRLHEIVPADRVDVGRVFGEALPEGLILA
jgi:molecular chaperone DnaK (HSP70)